jgi:ParB/RepB/Spo0J family partition protein
MSKKKPKSIDEPQPVAAGPPELRIVYRPRASLERYAHNARTHSPEQVDQIGKSIREFGFTNPILIRKNTILAGHGRLAAAEQLGLETVPVIELDYLTETQARALVLADNKLALNSGWDEALLRAELGALQENDADLSLLGWSDAELSILLNADEPPPEVAVSIPELFAVHVTVRSEGEQKLLYEELSKRGLECKVITT